MSKAMEGQSVNHPGEASKGLEQGIEILTLPTAPSPVTTHWGTVSYGSCIRGFFEVMRMAHLQRLGSRACRHDCAKYVHAKKENDKGGAVQMSMGDSGTQIAENLVV